MSTMSALTSSDRVSKVSFAMEEAVVVVVWLGYPLSFNARFVKAAGASYGVVDGKRNAWAVVKTKARRFCTQPRQYTGEVLIQGCGRFA